MASNSENVRLHRTLLLPGPLHVVGITLLALPYHGKGIIASSRGLEARQLERSPDIRKEFCSQTYSAHIFSANVAWKIGKERVPQIDLFLFHSLSKLFSSLFLPRIRPFHFLPHTLRLTKHSKPPIKESNILNKETTETEDNDEKSIAPFF